MGAGAGEDAAAHDQRRGDVGQEEELRLRLHCPCFKWRLHCGLCFRFKWCWRTVAGLWGVPISQ